MADFLIVTDDESDWRPYLPSDNMVTVDEYLHMGAYAGKGAMQVLNLCRSYDYLSTGYYCSLMAEARGHRVIPKVVTINDLTQDRVFSLPQAGLDTLPAEGNELIFKLYFGHSQFAVLEKIFRKVFERFTVPILEVKLQKVAGKWQFDRISPFPYQDLNDAEQDEFVRYLEVFSKKVWCLPKPRTRYQCEIAMLVDDSEKMPPSNKVALARFIEAADRLGMGVKTIGPDDLARLAEFDGLFIRVTTNISHYTYRFAKEAESMGLVVMDDPESIMKCTNKVFLTELLNNHGVPTPKSVIFKASDPDWADDLINSIGLPLVLKVPDGAFSLGVVKVKDKAELLEQASTIFKHSALILAQEYLPTEFDWRIGVLNRQAIYACRYYMCRGHWQIYQHHNNGEFSEGGFDALDLQDVPWQVVDAALNAANLIGDGFYGVDLKVKDGHVYVIEVNDNPSIDNGIEDGFLGEQLYDRIMAEFLRRIQQRNQ